MMNEDTIQKLTEMKMSGMADAYKQQSLNKDYQSMDFEERFMILVDTEHSRRQSNKLQRLIKQAKFDIPTASIAEIEYHEDRRLPKELILRLASGTYLENNNNIILMGATGAGKTYLSNAFGIEACRQFHTVFYTRLPELLDEFKIAKSQPDDSYKKLMKKIVKYQLLILDDWLLHKLSEEEIYLTMEIIEKREKKTSTIFCAQSSPKGWLHKLGGGPTGEAVIDRIVPNSHEITMDGDLSMRKRSGINTNY